MGGALPSSTYAGGIVNPRIADILERSDKLDPDQFFSAYSEVLSEILNAKLGRSPTNLRKAVVLSVVEETTGQLCWWRPDFSGFTGTAEPTYNHFRVRLLEEGAGTPEDAGTVKPLKTATADDPIQAALLDLQPRATTKADIMSAGIPLPLPEVGDIVIVDLDNFPDVRECTYMGYVAGAASPGMGFPMMGGALGGPLLQQAQQQFVAGDPAKGTLGKTYEGLEGFTIMHPWGQQAVRVTSPFGMRCHPKKSPPKGPPCIKKTGSAKGKTRAKIMHNGIDLAWSATPNAIMYACADGEVFYSKDKNPGKGVGGGYQIGIDHGEHPDQFGNLRKWVSYYCHMHPQSARMSPKGRVIKEGEPVGIENNTGGSTGAHLHFMLQCKGHPQAGDSSGNLNPELFIDRLQPKGGTKASAGTGPISSAVTAATNLKQAQGGGSTGSGS